MTRCLESEKPDLGRPNGIVSAHSQTPWLGEAVSMESRNLEDWEEMGRKEDRQGKALLSI